VYRGLSDTRTPFYATLASNALNVVLGYGLIFSAGLGIR
jgi:Na+-driven multidrug efflux pump